MDWLTPVLTLFVLRMYVKYIEHNEKRPNLVEIPDPLFDYLPIYDTSVPCSIIILTCGSLFLYNYDQANWSHVCWASMVFAAVRTLILWLHPFRGHHTMKPLRDPFIEFIMGPSVPILMSDLSVSGHTSLLFGMGLLMPNYKSFYWASTLATGILLVLSRAHYTADVILAPMVAYCCYVITQ